MFYAQTICKSAVNHIHRLHHLDAQCILKLLESNSNNKMSAIRLQNKPVAQHTCDIHVQLAHCWEGYSRF